MQFYSSHLKIRIQIISERKVTLSHINFVLHKILNHFKIIKLIRKEEKEEEEENTVDDVLVEERGERF